MLPVYTYRVPGTMTFWLFGERGVLVPQAVRGWAVRRPWWWTCEEWAYRSTVEAHTSCWANLDWCRRPHVYKKPRRHPKAVSPFLSIVTRRRTPFRHPPRNNFQLLIVRYNCSSCRYNERQLIDVTVVRRVHPRAERSYHAYHHPLTNKQIAIQLYY